MARRIDIELTSAQPDGTWTWRAAGARQPRGVLDGELLYAGVKAGDVVRADADFELEGITIVSVSPPKEKRAEAGTLPVLGSGQADTPGVTTQLVGRGSRDRRERRPGSGRESRYADRPGRPQGPDRRGARRGDRSGSAGSASDAGAATTRRSSEQPTTDANSGRPRTPGGDRPRTPSVGGQGGGSTRRDRPDGRDRSDNGGRSRSRDRAEPGERRPNHERPRGRERPASTPTAAEPHPRARRLNPGRTNRNAVLASLPPEQQPIAEQVLRGGIPAVRTAIHLEREKAAAEGRPAPKAEALLAIAENLLPSLKAAEWRDRAEAATKMMDDLALRDLRSLVAGADTARDEASRELAVKLREGLEGRIRQLREQWEQEVASHLDGGRVVRAVRLSARPPDAGSRLSAELADRLAGAAGAAMAPTTPSDRWVALIETVAESPVRRSVKPAGWPAEPSDELERVARQQAGRIPSLAELLGVNIPLPPGPVRREGPGDHRPARPVPPPPASPTVPPPLAAPDGGAGTDD